MALENWLVPAPVLRWLGTTSNDWANPANWDLNRIPGPTDVVQLGSIAAGAQQPTVKAGTPARPEEACSTIVLTPDFAGKTLTIEGRLRLTGVPLQEGDPPSAVFWNQNATITGPGALAVNGRFIWTLGTISVKTCTSTAAANSSSGRTPRP
jgi:hypothetical protein